MMLHVCVTNMWTVQVEDADSDKAMHCDNDRPDSISPSHPLITLTDMTNSAELSGGGRRQQLLYSEDFDAIHEYLQNTDSPMLNLSPSWLRDSATVHVFPPTPVNHKLTLTNSSATQASDQIRPPTVTSALQPVSSTIDMSSSIGSSSLHGREVCAHISVIVACLVSMFCFV